jgi:hypothetical protein
MTTDNPATASNTKRALFAPNEILPCVFFFVLEVFLYFKNCLLASALGYHVSFRFVSFRFASFRFVSFCWIESGRSLKWAESKIFLVIEGLGHAALHAVSVTLRRNLSSRFLCEPDPIVFNAVV